MHWAHRENSIEFYRRSRLFFRAGKRPFEDWLNRLVVMGVIEPTDWDIENGKFFKIPMCCVKWYLFMDRMGIVLISKMTSYIYGYQPGNYVKCPKCHKRNQ